MCSKVNVEIIILKTWFSPTVTLNFTEQRKFSAERSKSTSLCKIAEYEKTAAFLRAAVLLLNSLKCYRNDGALSDLTFEVDNAAVKSSTVLYNGKSKSRAAGFL